MESLLYIPAFFVATILLGTISVVVIAVDKYLEEKEKDGS